VLCSNVDVKANSDPWTSNYAQANDVILWTVDRVVPFDTYGRTDQFCFRPRQSGDCAVSPQNNVVVEVNCTNGSKKLTNIDFEGGERFSKVICVDAAGPSCKVEDKHSTNWNGGPTACERRFEDVAFSISALPQCTPW
jgi:hypothetical protein